MTEAARLIRYHDALETSIERAYDRRQAFAFDVMCFCIAPFVVPYLIWDSWRPRAVEFLVCRSDV